LSCPPFSVAGKQLGKKDERNLFPAMVDLVDRLRPQALVIENVRAEKPDFLLTSAGDRRKIFSFRFGLKSNQANQSDKFVRSETNE